MTVGFALAWMAVPTVGKRVFLRVVSTIPTVMHGMTTAAATVKKAAFGRSKSPAFAGTKTVAYWPPLSGSPLGTSVSLCSCASADVDIAVGRRATLWGITALLADWVTDMTHVMLFLAITCWAVGVAARLQTVILTLAIIIAGSYHLIRGLVPIVTCARAL